MPRRPRNRAGSAMATTALAWDQTPEYLSSCNREIPQGGRDTYGKLSSFFLRLIKGSNILRVVLEDNEDERVSSTDVTSFIFGYEIASDSYNDFLVLRHSIDRQSGARKICRM